MKNFFNATLIFVAIMFLGSCKSEVIENRIAMHTLITLRASGFESEVAIEESFARIEEIEKIFEEDLRSIESNPREFVKIHPETLEILEQSQKDFYHPDFFRMIQP